MNLFEFLSHSGFEDGEFIFVNLLTEDGVADPDLGYKGQLRNIPFKLLRCMVKDYKLEDHYREDPGVEYVQVCFINVMSQ